MAESLISGLLASHGDAVRSRLMASDIDADRRRFINQRYGIATTEKNREAADGTDILVLAVEPQVLDAVLDHIAPAVAGTALVISVAAGYPIQRLTRRLPHVPIRKFVRAMPNTPSMIREGVTAWASVEELPSEDAAVVDALFLPVGKVLRVKETALDAVTGLSGSGPAYVYTMIEALADGGVKMGLSRQTAQLLAAQTVLGAARMVLESGEHPAMLKDRVASPGGTTIAGLHALEQGRFRAAIVSAVEAAVNRSIELGL